MSDYDNILTEIRKMFTTASKEIPRLYEALIKEGLDPFSARDRIEKDLIDIVSKRTIRDNLPDEAKHTEKITKKAQQVIQVASNGQQRSTAFIPLPANAKLAPTIKRFKLDYDLEIRDQVIPVIVTVFIDWDKQEVEVDSIEPRRD